MNDYIISFLYPDGFFIIEKETGNYLNPNNGELVDNWDDAPFYYSDTKAETALKKFLNNE